jgi:hypothetical protein
MRSSDTVRRAFELRRRGWTQMAIGVELGVHKSTVGQWLRPGEETLLIRRDVARRRPCPTSCPVRAELPGAPYAYLLGQYLGDGWINLNLPRGVQRLLLACCARYVGIVEECRNAVGVVMPGRAIGTNDRSGVTYMSCYSTHWSCLFPQCGPGAKHTRPILLRPWQEKLALVDHPEQFVRGLIHSDGWRGNNPVRGASGKRYVYTRYQFSNRSPDIRDLFVRACDAIGAECTQMNAYNIAVSRRHSVAILDRWVGPKY